MFSTIKFLALVFAAALFLTAIAPALAHDTWLIPARFKIAPGETAIFDLTSGMAFPALDVGPKRKRIQAVVCRLAGRTFDLNDFEAAPKSLRIKAKLPESGIAALWVKSPPKEIELKPEQVQEYLDEIDAPATVRQQWTETKEPKRWRESYNKHSKTFIRIGDAKADASWREPVGMFLEIVPEKDPTALRAGDDFPVKVLRDGKPFANFSLGILAEGDSKGSINKTDAAGKVSFRLDKNARWLVRGTDLRKSTKHDVDWESDFTTLTIEVAKQ
jgi:uncharacterized GH25 family protein